MAAGSSEMVRVELAERSYSIRIAPGSLAGSARDLSAQRPSRVVLCYDQNVQQYAQVLQTELAQLPVDAISVPPGESSKSVAQAERLWQFLVELGADRQTLLVAVGGGVVGDLAGFVAATYARGIRFCQVPTTLLAQVDSSVGGKVGINLPQAKNMVGAFWQPTWVAIDPDTLATLPDREYRSGLAEVVKYGVILDPDFFAYLEDQAAALNRRDARVLTTVIARCCRLKAGVVQADERETSGLRAVLNYGHTFAHAFETLTGYGELLHGEAVAIGMLCASRLAAALQRIPAEMTARQAQLLERLRLPTQVPQLAGAEVLACMSKDKKVAHGKLRFVLPSRMGHVELVQDVDPGLVLAALEG